MEHNILSRLSSEQWNIKRDGRVINNSDTFLGILIIVTSIVVVSLILITIIAISLLILIDKQLQIQHINIWKVCSLGQQ